MNITQYFTTHHRNRGLRSLICGSAATAVLGIIAASLPTTAGAQSTTSHIFGQAPAGETVVAQNGATGLHRHAKANAKGRYTIDPLPAGDYIVTLEKDGKTVDKQSNVSLVVGRGAEVDFGCPNDQCAAADNR
ncbi:carboxypeptidase-like regulatory domain-containing protein [Dyella mobilis]|uniref:Carboxypeptidase regulatory-like domain-containing protein n=1 Tax=Dyella mobilis TaxID=1849582 RepID=A0ABS2KI82_9GAMM|nr:carboxypeptidase-like regulatory domain-containing protein [Dyella mobilis]MBM7130600.1 carboxypeptidase regulatory-like domain-containing protein [Dyella mobilis]GLQ97227.1 hypothetical protein GCM10007863_16470 [Dyella mobilis]